MAETSETAEEFANRVVRELVQDPNQIDSDLEWLLYWAKQRDSAIAAAARREERARLVKRLREWSATWRHRADQEWMLPEHGLHDEFAARALSLRMAADLIESEAT